jgi:hypothetical protein
MSLGIDCIVRVAGCDDHHSTFRWRSGTPRTCGLFTRTITILFLLWLRRGTVGCKTNKDFRVSVDRRALDLRELFHQLCDADHFTLISDNLN